MTEIALLCSFPNLKSFLVGQLCREGHLLLLAMSVLLLSVKTSTATFNPLHNPQNYYYHPEEQQGEQYHTPTAPESFNRESEPPRGATTMAMPEPVSEPQEEPFHPPKIF